jgi:hypothetical protein
MAKAQTKLNDEDNIQNDIEELLQEVADCKCIIREKLNTDPDNLSAHRMYCAYIGKILEIKKTMIQARLTDQESLLLTALRSVVQTLIEKGEPEAATSWRGSSRKKPKSKNCGGTGKKIAAPISFYCWAGWLNIFRGRGSCSLC